MSLNSVLVIGAGNFGAATALSLARHESSGKVILIDSGPYPNPRAASHDINKIVRDDYPDPAYTKMMVEAMARWRSDGLYSPYYHETGIVRADPNDYAERSIKSYKALGFHTDASFLSVDEARTRWGGVFASANFDGVDKVHWNPHGGWAEADKALAAVIQAAIDNGVKYRANEATKLLLDSSGACIGARLNDGSEIHVETVVLAAGASSSTLLYQSDPSNVALHTGDRAKSTSAMTFFGRWDNERRERFKDVPVMVNWTDDVKGESMSMTADGRIKFNSSMSFTNIQPQGPGKFPLSVVPTEAHKFTWSEDFPNSLKETAKKTMHGIYGDAVNGVLIEGYRMCWDALTPTDDFLVTPHPHSKNLFLATGGSFHGWKFLPVIGDYIVQMLRGTLQQDLYDKWAWDKKTVNVDMEIPTYKVSGDVEDLFAKK